MVIKEVVNIDKWLLVVILIIIMALIILMLYIKTEFIGQGSFDYSNRKKFGDISSDDNKKPKIPKE